MDRVDLRLCYLAAGLLEQRHQGLRKTVEILLRLPDVHDEVAGALPCRDVGQSPRRLPLAGGLQLLDDGVVHADVVVRCIVNKEDRHVVLQPVELTSGATQVGCSSGARVEHTSRNVQLRRYKKQRRVWTQRYEERRVGK